MQNIARTKKFGYKVESKQFFWSGVAKKYVDIALSYTLDRARLFVS